MSISTNGFVCGNFENNVFDVLEKVKEALKNFEHPHPSFEGRMMKSDFSMKVEYSGFSRFFTCDFKDGVDARHMFIFFDCSHDYNTVYDGSKLIFSLGAWGNSEKIIKTMLDQFDEKSYFITNDCVDDWVVYKE
jgi:hypothetical protein